MRRLALALLVAVLVAGCSARPRAVVVERSLEQRPPAPVVSSRESAPREYVVQRGDTLFGIAFRHGLDHRDIARWNRLESAHLIYPGQRLVLSGPAAETGVAARRPAEAPREPPRNAIASGPPPPQSGVTAPQPPATTTPPARPPASTPPARPAAAPAGGGAVVWRWPTEGQLLTTFSAGDPTRQGVDIVGSAGQPVLAAADGEVVYSGAGLVGYGELIIIKHSDTWLSAYGHNRKRLVAEGQRVKAGQQIAEMGRSGASRDMLHFEIRRNGRPTDPLALLPRR